MRGDQNEADSTWGAPGGVGCLCLVWGRMGDRRRRGMGGLGEGFGGIIGIRGDLSAELSLKGGDRGSRGLTSPPPNDHTIPPIPGWWQGLGAALVVSGGRGLGSAEALRPARVDPSAVRSFRAIPPKGDRRRVPNQLPLGSVPSLGATPPHPHPPSPIEPHRATSIKPQHGVPFRQTHTEFPPNTRLG